MIWLMNFGNQLRTFCTVTDRSIKAWKFCISLAERCNSMNQFKVIHAIFIVHGLHRNPYAVSKLLDFCALSDAGHLSYASLLFSQIPCPNCFTYNLLIKAYSTSPKPHLALEYFNLMLQTLLHPDGYTFPSVLVACANGNLMAQGMQLHGWVIKNGMSEANAHVQTELVRLYAECKILDDAKKVFDDIPSIDVVQCNVLATGFLKCGMVMEALEVFRTVLGSGIQPDEFFLTTGLTACAQLGALELGKWIHEYIRKRSWLVYDNFIGTALIDMYSKCGCFDIALEVFACMPKRSNFAWTAIIGAYAAHGDAMGALQCLERMHIEDRIKPDEIAILGALSACKHAGLLKEGQFLLENMESLYGTVPEHEHYSCVVDLICRAGRLGEALELIRNMPVKPLGSVWGALLSGCRQHNNVILAELAVKELLVLQDGNVAEGDSAYVQLSNIYLAAHKVDDARRVRKMIGDRGVKKTPGCSAIEVDGEVNRFYSGDICHNKLSEIHMLLYLLHIDGLADHDWIVRGVDALEIQPDLLVKVM